MLISSFPSLPSPVILQQLIQSDLDDDEDERLGMGGGRGTLRFKHKLPVELKGPEGVHVVHGSTGTLLTSDLNSLPEDDQRALARSLEALNGEGGLYSERNARTESAKSTPMHRHKDGDTLSESPLEITELWLAEASLVWAQPWLVCVLVPPRYHPEDGEDWRRSVCSLGNPICQPQCISETACKRTYSPLGWFEWILCWRSHSRCFKRGFIQLTFREWKIKCRALVFTETKPTGVIDFHPKSWEEERRSLHIGEAWTVTL